MVVVVMENRVLGLELAAVEIFLAETADLGRFFHSILPPIKFQRGNNQHLICILQICLLGRLQSGGSAAAHEKKKQR